MELKVTLQGREKVIQIIQKQTLSQPEYCSGMDCNTPFACKIGEYIIQCNGNLEFPEKIGNQKLLNQLSACGLLESENTSKEKMKGSSPTLRIFLSGLSDEIVDKVIVMLENKKNLLLKAIPGLEFNRKCITFPFYQLSPEERKACQDFVKSLLRTAKMRKWIKGNNEKSEENNSCQNEKYLFRIWLNQLNMKGKEYAVTRKILLGNLKGNTAYSDEKKQQIYSQKRKERRRKEKKDEAFIPL